MPVLPRLVLGFVAVAILVRSILACSDIKMFLAPCTVKESGTRITKEQALDIQSGSVNIDALRAIADVAVEYFDFDLGVFNGKCEIRIDEASRIFNCSKASDKCFPYPDKPPPPAGCMGSGPVPKGPTSPDSNLPGETIIAICVGNRCKGFSFLFESLGLFRRRRCGGSIEFCPDEPQEPLCEAEILSNCCNTPSRVCVCETCSLRIWRQSETSSGQLAFIHRQSGNTCICSDEG